RSEVGARATARPRRTLSRVNVPVSSTPSSLPDPGESSRLREITPGIYRVERVSPSGWGACMIAVRLADGGLLLHSPTWIDDAFMNEVRAIGIPSVLFAPNHFHHLSLGAYKSRFPDAIVVASDVARRRL